MNERERHQKATEIFVEAMDLAEADRDAFIGRACAGDQGLEKEVRSLLRYDHADTRGPAEVSGVAVALPRDRAGQTVGRFRIVGPLGDGGMGLVWKAEDPLLRRTVAIKFLSESQARSEVARRRFLREARAMSSISHPNIATVFDAGEVDGDFYIAMQMVDGWTLHESLRKGPVAPRTAVRIAATLARALDHAHKKGVVHRDVTTNNIIRGDYGEVMLVDFGLARQSADSSRLSKSGQLIGTVGFIAPEAIRGDEITPQSDVFSLGVVLYEMLTGHLPFEHEKPLKVLQATLKCEPELPGRFVSGVPIQLDRVLANALARDTRARYVSMAAMAEDLEALLAGGLADEPGQVTRAPRWTEPPGNPGRPRLTIVILLVAAALAVVLLLLFHERILP